MTMIIDFDELHDLSAQRHFLQAWGHLNSALAHIMTTADAMTEPVREEVQTVIKDVERLMKVTAPEETGEGRQAHGKTL